MREVAILGIGQVPVDEHWDKSLLALASEAAFAALNRNKTMPLYVNNFKS